MSVNFDYSFPFIRKHECDPHGHGYANIDGDTGGETYVGISRNNWRYWGGWLDIDAMRGSASFPYCLDNNTELQEKVRDFYQINFWRIQWDSLNKRIAAKVMDISVNCGMAWGPKILQRAVGVTDDGIVGPATIAAANCQNVNALLQDMVLKVEQHYDDIVAAHPDQRKFLKGWKNRAAWVPS